MSSILLLSLRMVDAAGRSRGLARLWLPSAVGRLHARRNRRETRLPQAGNALQFLPLVAGIALHELSHGIARPQAFE